MGSWAWGPFDEDDLYANLDWLCGQQARIDERLFAHRCRERPAPRLFLYDVTSSYLRKLPAQRRTRRPREAAVDTNGNLKAVP